jgi:hypothetical protein
MKVWKKISNQVFTLMTQVFIELKEHADYVKTEIEDKQKRLEALEQSFRSIEAKDHDINKRMDRVFKVYELLEKRIDSFKMLPAANKKPLSQAEQEFKAQLGLYLWMLTLHCFPAVSWPNGISATQFILQIDLQMWSWMLCNLPLLP